MNDQPPAQDPWVLVEVYRTWYQRVLHRFTLLGTDPTRARTLRDGRFPIWAYENEHAQQEWLARTVNDEGQGILNALQLAAVGRDNPVNTWPGARMVEAAQMIVMVGLPASGKTTAARKLLEELHAAGTRAFRVSRDDFRVMGQPIPDTGVDEEVITIAEHAAISALLLAGATVIVDDTNLDPDHLPALVELSRRAGAHIVYRDECLDVPLEECLRRDAARENPVGEKVIRQMHALFVRPWQG